MQTERNNQRSYLRLVMLCVIVALHCMLGLSDASGQMLHTNQGVLSSHRLKDFGDGWFQFASSGQTQETNNVRVEYDHLVRWGAWTGIREESAVWLVDGSWVCGDVSLVGNGDVRIHNDWLEIPNIPSNTVRAILFDPGASLEDWVQWDKRLRDARGDRDIVWLVDGGRQSGVLRWNGNTDLLSLDTGGTTVEIPVAEVQAVVVSPSLVGRVPAQPKGLLVAIEDGSLLDCTKLSIDRNQVVLETASLLRIVSLDPAVELAKAITMVAQPAPSDSLRVESFAVANYRHLAQGLLSWELGVNRDASQRPLITESGIVPNGIGMHSTSQVAYRWDGRPGKLRAELQMATPRTYATEGLGSVLAKVLVARGGQLETIFEAELFRDQRLGKESAIVEVDVDRAQLIVLVVEEADRGQVGDDLLWLDPRIDFGEDP